jgi:RNA polymerase sigma-70 factor (ECF subfamily)
LATLSDAELIALSVEDARAFDVVFRRHYPAIHRFVNRRLGARFADDLAAETFAIAFARRGTFDADRPSAAPWLYGIAANLVRSHARAERRQLRALARTGIDPIAPDATDRSDDRLDASLAVRRLAARLAQLRPTEREVLLLSAWTDLTYDELAEALGVPVGTVRSRLSRARTHIREPVTGSGQVQGASQLTMEARDE